MLQEALAAVRQTAADAEATEEDVRAAEALLQETVDALEKITCTVILEPDNGTEAIIITVANGEMAEAPPIPVKEGYTFEGWFAEGEETAFDFDNTPVTTDITLKAKWEETQGGGDNPGGDNPGGDNPGGDNPGGNPDRDNPGGDNSGGNNKPAPVSVSGAVIKLSKATLTYNGKAQKPAVTVTCNGNVLSTGGLYILVLLGS